ncbi:hypothetical protein EYZ11_003842 [Aspergillus tanneri]|uniref:Ketosynthase family 3 (KS3) domain-containing protein n=1 Tax=Aspergillus tanneri TaxID=1220188 RepID=A0A4S3JPD3_9EURO|nr:hypothetical protein EYZ11_003842 [Aspergillus tanneri]
MGSVVVEAPRRQCIHILCADEFNESPRERGDQDKPHIQYDTSKQVPIAIVGMAVRLPGGVRSTDSFWDLLLSQRDVSREVPQDRYNIDAFYSDSQSRAVKVRRGFFLDDDLAEIYFSASKVGPIEAGYQDPQQRLLMEVVWECMDNAGQTGWRGKDIERTG